MTSATVARNETRAFMHTGEEIIGIEKACASKRVHAVSIHLWLIPAGDRVRRLLPVTDKCHGQWRETKLAPLITVHAGEKIRGLY